MAARSSQPARRVLLALVCALAAILGLAISGTPAQAATGVGISEVRWTSTIDAEVRSERPVTLVRYYLINTKTGSRYVAFAYLHHGTTTYGTWQAFVATGRFGTSAWRVEKVGVYGPKNVVLRTKSIAQATAAKYVQYSSEDYGMSARLRTTGPTTARSVSFTSGIYQADEMVDSIPVTVTATFRRPSGSTFTRTQELTTTENGRLDGSFGPYGMEQIVKFTYDAHVALAHKASFTF